MRRGHSGRQSQQGVGNISVSVEDGASSDQVVGDITTLMRERRNISANETDNFSVMDTRQIAETLSSTTRILTALLGAVAAVSLLVGGIGIMNIMLVSVTERTREIGTRLAIGALERVDAHQLAQLEEVGHAASSLERLVELLVHARHLDVAPELGLQLANQADGLLQALFGALHAAVLPHDVAEFFVERVDGS